MIARGVLGPWQGRGGFVKVGTGAVAALEVLASGPGSSPTFANGGRKNRPRYLNSSGILGPMNNAGKSSGRNYAVAVVLIVAAVLSFMFLSGPTAVFIGIAAAVAGAVFLVMGIQAANDSGAPDTSTADWDWDGDFRREFGGGDVGGGPEGRR